MDYSGIHVYILLYTLVIPIKQTKCSVGRFIYFISLSHSHFYELLNKNCFRFIIIDLYKASSLCIIYTVIFIMLSLCKMMINCIRFTFFGGFIAGDQVFDPLSIYFRLYYFMNLTVRLFYFISALL